MTRPNGTNGSLSCVSRLSRKLMNTCVVRPFATAQAKAIVPRTFGCWNGSSGMVRPRHACASFGSPAIPNWAHVFGRILKIAASS
jgi:hypothetical protein